MPRTPSHHENDARRVIKGRDPTWLRGYIARHAIRMLVADKELTDQGYVSELSPGLVNALRLLRGVAKTETGRAYLEI